MVMVGVPRLEPMTMRGLILHNDSKTHSGIKARPHPAETRLKGGEPKCTWDGSGASI